MTGRRVSQGDLQAFLDGREQVTLQELRERFHEASFDAETAYRWLRAEGWQPALERKPNERWRTWFRPGALAPPVAPIRADTQHVAQLIEKLLLVESAKMMVLQTALRELRRWNHSNAQQDCHHEPVLEQTRQVVEWWRIWDDSWGEKADKALELAGEAAFDQFMNQMPTLEQLLEQYAPKYPR